MSRPWMPLYISDYLGDTQHLSTIEHGAYLLLIMHYWQQESLPADEARLARIARMTPKEWSNARATLAALFDPGWKHGRIDVEIAVSEEKYEKRADAGHKGGKASALARKRAKLGAAAEQTASNASSNAPAKSNQPQPQPSNPEANASGAEAAPLDPSIPERDYFMRSREVLGPKSGAMIAKLLKAKGGNVALARAAIEQASQKDNPTEYVAAICHGARNGNRTSNYRADPAAGRATARETQHVTAMGGGALRFLQESKSAGQGGDLPGRAGSAEVIDLGKRSENAR